MGGRTRRRPPVRRPRPPPPKTDGITSQGGSASQINDIRPNGCTPKQPKDSSWFSSLHLAGGKKGGSGKGGTTRGTDGIASQGSSSSQIGYEPGACGPSIVPLGPYIMPERDNTPIYV